LWLIVLAVLVLGGVAEVIIYGYLERPGWIGVSGKKFWDYLELLLVPAALALGVYWLNRRQDERDQQAEEERSRREHHVENERAQDAAVQAYLDQLTQLLVTQRDQNLIRMQVDDEVRQVIQARSEPLLRSVDPDRRWSLVLFLSVMGLLTRDRPLVSLAGADLVGVDGRGAPLGGIDLSRANLSGADLSGADLSGAYLDGANLTRATMRGINLSGADLMDTKMMEVLMRDSNLSEALLNMADLSGAHLVRADLSGAYLTGTNLMDANLIDANLGEAFLIGADLSGTVLSGAVLVEAKGITNEELEQQARSLEGATLPNGQKYEDWLKDKEGRKEDREKQ